ncbi:hypothetical protein EMCRGX_G033873 [Ephydatia muelleri]
MSLVTMMKFEAVIFDIGGVVITAPQLTIAAVEQELGLERGFLTLVFANGWPNNAFCRLERGELKLSQFCPKFEDECHQLAQSQGVLLPKHFSAKALFDRIGSDVQPIPEMLEALQILKKSGLKLCALTNNWIDDTQPSANPLHGLQECFDLVLESAKLGMRKPEPQIYSLACKRLDVKPERIVYLDDIGRNLKPAQGMGMTTILVRDARTALKELERVLGINLAQQQTSKL